MENANWLSVEKAAPIIDMKPDGIYRAIREGIFPFRFVRIGRQIRINAADLRPAEQAAQPVSARAEAV